MVDGGRRCLCKLARSSLNILRLIYSEEEKYAFSLIICDGDGTGGEYHDEIVVKIWSAP
jgi:hypothetical protein